MCAHQNLITMAWQALSKMMHSSQDIDEILEDFVPIPLSHSLSCQVKTWMACPYATMKTKAHT